MAERIIGPIRWLTGARRRLPDFLLIGAQRAGTTTLFQHLALHPEIAAPVRKEIHYFDRNFWKGPRWYRAHFPRPKAEDTTVTGEATPYYLFEPRVPQRVRDLVPEAKFLVMLRNPVDRAYSHYQHEVRLGQEKLGFAEALQQEEARLAPELERMARKPKYYSAAHQHFSYVARGKYDEQLERWFGVFPRSRFLVIQSERFFEKPQAEWRRVTKFLGLSDWTPDSFDVLNALSYRPIPDELRTRLKKTFAPHTARLQTLTGERFDWG